MAASEESPLAEQWFIDRRLRGLRAILRRTLADLLGEIGMHPDDTHPAALPIAVSVPVDVSRSLIDLQGFGDLVAGKLGRIIGQHIPPDYITFSQPNDQLLITVRLITRSSYDYDTRQGSD